MPLILAVVISSYNPALHLKSMFYRDTATATAGVPSKAKRKIQANI